MNYDTENCGNLHPWAEKANCERPAGHGRIHRTYAKNGQISLEWESPNMFSRGGFSMEPKPEQWAGPQPVAKPVPVFDVRELAELYILLHSNHDVTPVLLDKVAKLLKEAL